MLLTLLVIAETLPLRAEEPAVAPANETPLSGGQIRALGQLRLARADQPVPLFLFTDPNKDPDDLSVLVMVRYLQTHSFVDLRCVVTTLGDLETRTTRAKFARGVLDDLGLTQVEVGVGVDYSLEVSDATGALDVKATEGRRRDHQVFIKSPLLRRQVAVDSDGPALVKRALEQVPDRSAVWLINSGMADPAALLRDAPELVQQKTAKVVIMGGIDPEVDRRGLVAADQRAYNNTTHQASADFTYERLQELGVPLVVVNKEATYSAAVPRSFYDDLAATQNPIGIYLRDQQKQSLAHLWEGIHQGNLPPALTPEWFFKTFTELDPSSSAGKAALSQATEHAEDFERVWNQVSRFNLYDPLALLAATPGASELVFRYQIPLGVSGPVTVVGQNSVKDAVLVKDLLGALSLESLNRPKLPN